MVMKQTTTMRELRRNAIAALAMMAVILVGTGAVMAVLS